MRNVLLVKYGEIALRGKNRGIAENRLIKAIIKRLEPYPGYMVYKEQGRILVVNEEGEFDYDVVIGLVTKVFGVTAVCPAVQTENEDVKHISQIALSSFKEAYPNPVSFKVITKRSKKSFPMTSTEASGEIGGYVLENMPGYSVDVHKPEANIFVEIRNSIYVYCKIIPAGGGLPYGGGGKATVLMSGGIDSPVAAYLTARRGVEIEAVYFDSPPYTSQRARQKVVDLAKVLSEYTGELKLHIVPFTEVQLKIYDRTPPEKLTILLKRAMLRTAEQIALKNGSHALITGDSIGQVASQTMEALFAINPAAQTMPVIRPLATSDKQPIIDMAKEIGTYEISSRPYEDCCTVFVAKHPEIRPKRSIIESIEKTMIGDGLLELIDKAVENTETLVV